MFSGLDDSVFSQDHIRLKDPRHSWMIRSESIIKIDHQMGNDAF